MDSLIIFQSDVYTRIKKAYSNFKKSPKERLTREYLEGRLESVEQLWYEFLSGHKQLVQTHGGSLLNETDYIKQDLYEKAEEAVLDYKSSLKVKLKTFTVYDLNKSESSYSQMPGNSKLLNVKLPDINIPTFSGKYSEWNSFRDLFKSVIHNNENLAKVQKLNYLKGYLTGEAEQLIRYTPITEANYDKCWALLESRYNNKKYMANCILKRLLGQRNVNVESSGALKELLNTTNDCLNALENIGIDIRTWDIIVIHTISQKLDNETRKQWELKTTSDTSTDELPTLEQFRSFLESRFKALEFIEPKRSAPHASNIQDRSSRAFHSTNNISIVCEYCSENHKVYSCKSFAQIDVEIRRKFVKDNNLCFNCLSNHQVRFCKAKTKCRICKKRHHSLLHPRGSNIGVEDRESTIAGIATSSNVPAESEGTVQTVACFSGKGGNRQVLLATAVVKAVSENGNKHYTLRALLDQGSQSSFITEGMVQCLRLERAPAKGTISGVGGNQQAITNGRVSLQLISRYNPLVKITVEAFVLKSITSFMPVKTVHASDWIELNDLQLADPAYHTPNKIDMLLGAEVYGKILQEGIKRDPRGSLIAQATSFGWILSGAVSSTTNDFTVNVLHCCLEQQEMLKRFWEIESDRELTKEKKLTEEELFCEKYYTETTRRDDSGRFIVRLPMKTIKPEVLNSKRIAERRLLGLERKFKNDNYLKESYKKVIDEYLDLNHLVPVSPKDVNNPDAIYLPHHAVIKDDKDTTKVRVVFDASCKGQNGLSLNSSLMVGPTLQATLRHIIMRWRKHPICLVADIVKMYRQINVSREDTVYQRILWRDEKTNKIKEFELTTVTFGTASAPYLAVKSLHQLSKEEAVNYPVAAEILKNDFSVDDLLTGAENEEQALQIYRDMNEMIKKGGFELQKWSSNSPNLFEDVIDSEPEKGKGLHFKWDNVIKILGLTWNRSDDTFTYKVTLPNVQQPVTKRKIISDIARFYDPIGWVGPSTIIAKILIQKLWLAGTDWDQAVPDQLLKEWLSYREELTKLEDISIPRWMGTTRGAHVELHGFCDASKVAFAAVVYLRVRDKAGCVNVALVSAKTKVAPVKQISIPKLELCGALLLAELLNDTANLFEIRKNHVRAWTDSTTVLAWINSHPSRWKVFVANRVAEILTNVESHYWSHVPTSQNPADCASRGKRPSELVGYDMWFKGPEFLWQENIEYGKPHFSTDMEANKTALCCVSMQSDESFITRFSSLTRMMRVVAYCRRFINNTKRNKSDKCTEKYLKTKELQEILNIFIRENQLESFTDEIKLIKQKKDLPVKSKLRSLTPFIDQDGILRVGGRLENAVLSYNRKHPIVLSNKTHLTSLIISYAHQQTLHGGPQLMLRYLQGNFFILNVQRAVKTIFRKCVTCAKNAAATTNPLMGQLPSARLTPIRPFKHSGLDYAGPIQIRTTKGRGHKSYKGYICLFVCMATRAVHLEAVSDQTTEGFLQAFKRFVSRRGLCTEIWSDNGTNFVGAAKIMQKTTDAENKSMANEIADALATKGCTWHFIPPHAPNFGGLWEAGIKSVKYHLKRVIGTTTLTFEEITTVLAQIEACLNSRPISALSDDGSGANVLTPGHFLIGESLVTAPDYNLESSNIGNLRRWQYTQRMLQDFWRQWSHEYLNKFLHRYKWSTQGRQPMINNIVLVKEDNLPPCKWLYGRIVALHPGSDQIVRVVTIKTKDSLMKRPTNKLCILPIAD